MRATSWGFRMFAVAAMSIAAGFTLQGSGEWGDLVPAEGIGGREKWEAEFVGPVSSAFNDIAQVEGISIAVGQSGRIIRSMESGVWHESTSGTSIDLQAVAGGDGTWVSVGSGLILSSRDGESWERRWSGR